MTFFLFVLIALFFIGMAYLSKKFGDESEAQNKQGSEREANDLANWQASGQGIAVKASLQIRYSDYNGGKTDRRIDATRYIPEGGYIEAWCHLRNEQRTFRVDRIQEAVDIDTGEIVTTRIKSFLRKHRQR